MPLHPQIVHFPLALAVLMPFIAGGLLLAWWRGWLPRGAFLVALALQAVLVGTGFLALSTGDEDGERIEERVPEAALEAHEEAGERLVYGSAAVLVLFVGAAVFAARKERWAQLLAALGTAGSIGAVALAIDAGHKGGELVYQHNAAAAVAATTTTTTGEGAAPGEAKPGKRTQDADSDD